MSRRSAVAGARRIDGLTGFCSEASFWPTPSVDQGTEVETQANPMLLLRFCFSVNFLVLYDTAQCPLMISSTQTPLECMCSKFLVIQQVVVVHGILFP